MEFYCWIACYHLSKSLVTILGKTNTGKYSAQNKEANKKHKRSYLLCCHWKDIDWISYHGSCMVIYNLEVVPSWIFKHQKREISNINCKIIPSINRCLYILWSLLHTVSSKIFCTDWNQQWKWILSKRIRWKIFAFLYVKKYITLLI